MTLFRRKGETSPPSQTTFKTGANDIERVTLQIGREMLGHARGHRAGLFSAMFWSDQLMDWAMKDPAFKVQLFRFVDVFPNCGSHPETRLQPSQGFAFPDATYGRKLERYASNDKTTAS